MAALDALVAAIAPSSLSVLVVGETGSGKEVTVQAVLAQSTRSNRPLIPINCAGLPEALIEAELFGYQRGAFTGAATAKPGLFEMADRGTLFLDEIGELPLGMQAKLLRVLETGEVRRLGSVETRVVDVRLVAATNQHLAARVAEGAFRPDLYFRLNGITLFVPPLRERRIEIPALARELARQAAREHRRPEVELSEDAVELLVAHDWPGNVRELKSVLRRAVVLSNERILTSHHLVQSDGSPFLRSCEYPHPKIRTKVDAAERACVVDALSQTNGNQGQAARLLGISRRTLLNKLDAHRIDRPRKAVHQSK